MCRHNWEIYLKLYGSFLWMGFNCLKVQCWYENSVYFLPLSTQKILVLIWLTLDRWKAVSRPWSHQVVLNLGPLDWESSALINWPLLRVSWENNVIPNVSALVNTGLTECAVCLMSACLFVWSFSLELPIETSSV